MHVTLLLIMLACLSTTIATLKVAVDDLLLLHRVGRNGSLKMVAKYCIVREVFRVAQHFALVAGAMVWPVSNFHMMIGVTVTALITATSIHDLVYRRRLVEYIITKERH